MEAFRRIRSVQHTTGRETVICVVGEPIRLEIARKGNRRSESYLRPIKRTVLGTKITAIDDAGPVYLVKYEGRSDWANPFMVGKPAGVEYFNDEQNQ